MSAKLRIYKSHTLYRFGLPETWIWICFVPDVSICSMGDNLDYDATLTAAKCHAHGRHGVDLDAPRTSL
jgi:hypothetical protein